MFPAVELISWRVANERERKNLKPDESSCQTLSAMQVAHEELQQMFASSQRLALLLTALRLGLPRLLRTPISLSSLAEKLSVRDRLLSRFLNALVRERIVDLQGGLYSLTPSGKDLLSESVADRILLTEQYSEAWLMMETSLREGRPAFEKLHGESVWSFRRRFPEAGAAFRRWMFRETQSQAPGLVPHLEFDAGDRVLEVGGGLGGLRIALRERFPQIQYSVLDDTELPGDPLCIQGNFFESVPEGYQAYILKSVLHDWADRDCVRILQNLARSMDKSARLWVIERDFVHEAGPYSMLDLHMMNITGGQERSRQEYQALFQSVGLQVQSLQATENGFLVFEVMHGN